MLIDDEALARQGLREQLTCLPDVEVCAEAQSMLQALPVIEAVQPDALFLDIRMPHGNGFELLKHLPHPLPVVICTAHQEYAVRAFDVQAVDYILKPVRPKRLEQAVARLRHALDQKHHPPALTAADRICLRTPERTVVTTPDHLILLKADGDFTRFTIEGEHSLLICQSLGAFEQTLPRPPFVRLDRSLIVNLERVESIEVSPTRGAHLGIRGLPQPLELGRTALKRLREAIPQIADLPG
jgi:two-component system LytT family response regulator